MYQKKYRVKFRPKGFKVLDIIRRMEGVKVTEPKPSSLLFSLDDGARSPQEEAPGTEAGVGTAAAAPALEAASQEDKTRKAVSNFKASAPTFIPQGK